MNIKTVIYLLLLSLTTLFPLSKSYADNAITDHYSHITAWDREASVELIAYDYATARYLYEKAVTYAELHTSTDLAKRINDFGNAFSEIENMDKSAQKKIKQERRDLMSHIDIHIRIHRRLASIYDDIGNIEQAEKSYLHTLTLAKKLNGFMISNKRLQKASKDLALFYKRNGNYDESESFFKKYYQFFLQEKDSLSDDYRFYLACDLQKYLALLYRAQEKWSQAEASYEFCLGGQKVKTSPLFISYAETLAKAGQFEKSETMLLEHIEDIKNNEKETNDISFGNATIQLGLLYASNKQYKEANTRLDAAVTKTIDYGKQRTSMLMKAWSAKAELAILEGRALDAIAILKQMLPTLEKRYGTKSEKIVALYKQLERAYTLSGSNPHLQQAQQLKEEIQKISTMTRAEIKVAWQCSRKPKKCADTNADIIRKNIENPMSPKAGSTPSTHTSKAKVLNTELSLELAENVFSIAEKLEELIQQTDKPYDESKQFLDILKGDSSQIIAHLTNNGMITQANDIISNVGIESTEQYFSYMSRFIRAFMSVQIDKDPTGSMLAQKPSLIGTRKQLSTMANGNDMFAAQLKELDNMLELLATIESVHKKASLADKEFVKSNFSWFASKLNFDEMM